MNIIIGVLVCAGEPSQDLQVIKESMDQGALYPPHTEPNSSTRSKTCHINHHIEYLNFKLVVSYLTPYTSQESANYIQNKALFEGAR